MTRTFSTMPTFPRDIPHQPMAKPRGPAIAPGTMAAGPKIRAHTTSARIAGAALRPASSEQGSRLMGEATCGDSWDSGGAKNWAGPFRALPANAQYSNLEIGKNASIDGNVGSRPLSRPWPRRYPSQTLRRKPQRATGQRAKSACRWRSRRPLFRSTWSSLTSSILEFPDQFAAP